MAVAAVLTAAAMPSQAAAGGQLTSGATAAVCGTSSLLVPECGVLMGVATYRASGQTWEQSVAAHEALVGRKMDVLHNYHQWNTLAPDAAEAARGTAGQKLIITWQAKRQDGSQVSWARIASGAEDAVIDAQARSIATFGAPIWLNFENEPEGLLGIRGTAAEYVAAWRRIHDRFLAAGARNAVWTVVYMGVADSDKFLQNAKALYPGDEYVDWIGWDPYNRAACFGYSWRDFSDTVAPFYDWLMANGFGSKPFMLAEYGSVEDAANPSARSDWFDGAGNALINGEFPNLKVVSYFDHPAPPATCDWRVETNPTTLAAYSNYARRLLTFSTTPVSTPGAPTSVGTTRVSRGAVVRWTPPTYTGEGVITSYRVTAQPGGTSVVVPGPLPITSAALSGLDPTIAYTFTVSATNSAGPGTASAPTTPLLPLSPMVTVPSPVSGGWKLNGTATLADGGLRLTDAITKNSVGSAFWPTPVTGATSYAVTFDSVIDGGTNADGLTLTFGNMSAGAKSTSLGAAGGGLGWSGIPGFAVALDTYLNGTDPSNNFVGIAKSFNPLSVKNLVWQATSTQAPPLRALRHISVIVSNNEVWVSVDGLQVVVGTVAIPASTLIGFTGSDGNRTDRHLVSAVTISAS